MLRIVISCRYPEHGPPDRTSKDCQTTFRSGRRHLFCRANCGGSRYHRVLAMSRSQCFGRRNRVILQAPTMPGMERMFTVIGDRIVGAGFPRLPVSAICGSCKSFPCVRTPNRANSVGMYAANPVNPNPYQDAACRRWAIIESRWQDLGPELNRIGSAADALEVTSCGAAGLRYRLSEDAAKRDCGK